jgi:hypothetical protein
MFALVYLHVVLAQRQIELNLLTSEASTSQTQYEDLRLKVAELGSSQEIISAAEGRLGMRQPASVTYVTPPANATAPGVPTSTPSTGTGSTSTGSTGPTSSSPGTTAAPAGDADWPQIKAELAGRP